MVRLIISNYENTVAEAERWLCNTEDDVLLVFPVSFVRSAQDYEDIAAIIARKKSVLQGYREMVDGKTYEAAVAF